MGLADIRHKLFGLQNRIQFVVNVEFEVLVVKHVPVECIVASFEIVFEVLKAWLLTQVHASLNHLVCHLPLRLFSLLLCGWVLHSSG